MGTIFLDQNGCYVLIKKKDPFGRLFGPHSAAEYSIMGPAVVYLRPAGRERQRNGPACKARFDEYVEAQQATQPPEECDRVM